MSKNKENEWIKTCDQLPPPGSFVLAYGDVCEGWTGGPLIAVFHWWREDWWDANMDAELVYGRPTHWMPLPKPPVDN